MIEIRRTDVFESWLAGLRDLEARARITIRIRRLSLGNFGDAKPVGEGVSELRIHHGPGYRIYFVRRGKELVILLCGGDKSDQSRDIAKAKKLAKEV
ncbi:MAG TPA: type II toxin-antitoxin system RelE/ParE family toxin [Rhizobiaceae bacterium]